MYTLGLQHLVVRLEVDEPVQDGILGWQDEEWCWWRGGMFVLLLRTVGCCRGVTGRSDLRQPGRSRVSLPMGLIDALIVRLSL